MRGFRTFGVRVDWGLVAERLVARERVGGG